MRLVFFVGFSFSLPSRAMTQRRVTWVIIVGTMQQPGRNFNPDFVAQMLTRIIYSTIT